MVSSLSGHVSPTNKWQNALLPECNIQCKMACSRLRAAGFVSRKQPSVLLLSDTHKERRMRWAMAHRVWRKPSWPLVVWSEEASPRLRSRDERLRKALDQANSTLLPRGVQNTSVSGWWLLPSLGYDVDWRTFATPHDETDSDL